VLRQVLELEELEELELIALELELTVLVTEPIEAELVAVDELEVDDGVVLLEAFDELAVLET